jgi:hypothetical protein
MGEVEPYILAQSANHNQEGKKATDNKTEFHYIKSVNEECPLVLVYPCRGTGPDAVRRRSVSLLCWRCRPAGRKGVRGVFLCAGRAEMIVRAAAAQQQQSIDTQSQPKCASRALAKQ